MSKFPWISHLGEAKKLWRKARDEKARENLRGATTRSHLQTARSGSNCWSKKVG